ncbi:hypothetical protein TVAG_432250 [Trichomonas vaginalis G3]|uniref:Uncharacterized protein n=1 Tax=Trichomonas vaginalis (strain ATCC PRA-98 / G3) TaxID=412133 RepID=A2F8T9_TRIV3|nr:hypothetical protein TVAG_432250 [Trichomonas vaginalis G3]|eukprot:XP_001311605.1 hypothetical protein [Trichomonas vaginalis G3]
MSDLNREFLPNIKKSTLNTFVTCQMRFENLSLTCQNIVCKKCPPTAVAPLYTPLQDFVPNVRSLTPA